MLPLKYDPARWICQCKSSLCEGIFYVYGEARLCSLWKYCRGHKHQLEYLYPQQSVFQRKVHLNDPQRYLAHAARSRDLRRVFVPEKVKAENRACYERNKCRYNAIAARKQAEQSLDRHPQKPKYDIPLPPCGKSCEDEDGCCPYDDDCHYPDWDEVQTTKIKAERRAEQCKRNMARYLERCASDPELAERASESDRAYRERVKADPVRWEQQKAKNRAYMAQKVAAETPEQREARLARKRECRKKRRDAENPEQREARLARRREREARQRELKKAASTSGAGPGGDQHGHQAH